MRAHLLIAAGFFALPAPLLAAVPLADIEARATALEPKVISWRRDIHQHPELGNRETRTAALVAKHLKSLGLEVREQVGKTGVIGILKGGRPGSVVALRADMDALPVTETTGLPFASTVRTTYNGQDVGVAHACGHDAHVAMLMGAAELLAAMRADIPGTILFVFQPAEEGPPAGEEGGARLMLAEGAFDNPVPDATFGIHVWPGRPGTLSWRPRGMMAEAQTLRIDIDGSQTHGAVPWAGIDIISQVATTVQELNRLTARTIDPTRFPTILTVATINAGVRFNIIPQTAQLTGTMRTFDQTESLALQERVKKTVDSIAAAYGSKATTSFTLAGPLTYNEPALSEWLQGPAAEAAGEGNISMAADPATASEDVSLFLNKTGGVYYFLGTTPEGVPLEKSPPNHSPNFTVNEKVLKVGVKAHALTALRFLEQNPPRSPRS